MCFGSVKPLKKAVNALSDQGLEAAEKIGNSLDRNHIEGILKGLPKDEVTKLKELAEAISLQNVGGSHEMADLLRELGDDAEPAHRRHALAH